MKVHIEKEIAEDLISYKLRNVQDHIDKILNRWNETDASLFLEKAKKGTYSEAENDAIDLKQMIFEEGKLKTLLNSL